MAGRGGVRGSKEESLFRSAEMSLVQLYIPSEIARDTIFELGELGNVQFKDLNPDVTPFQRSFVSDIRRLDEMDRRVRFLDAQMEKENVKLRPLESALPFVNAGIDGSRGPQLLDELAVRLREHEERVAQMNSSYEQLQKRLLELEEARHVLRETAVFFDQAEGRHDANGRTSTEDANAPLLDDVEGQGFARSGGDEGGYGTFDLEFVAGTIDRTRMATFERILWRVLRGNLYMNYAEIEEPFSDPTKEEPVRKNVFIIFAHGSELLAKIRKISESMGGTLYPIDSNADAREDSLREVTSRIEDLHNVLYTTSNTRRGELQKVAESLTAWEEVVRKEKLVYSTMNLFNYDARRKTLIAEGWCPTGALGAVQLALRRATENAGTSTSAVMEEIRTTEKPPTYQLTNKFTEGFQAIIDAYGIASPGEANPALFAVITFPFLFAVMFGDVFHAAIMLSSAAVMVIWERKLAKAGLGEIFDMFFYGRYIILLMGVFALYTGLLYNDIASQTMHLFSSGWKFPHGEAGSEIEGIKLDRVYPIGIDPAWHGASNALVFTNSLKMKMSIILGVAHMTFAILLNIPNAIHFGKPWLILAETIPQLLFLHSLFGYLCFLIILKWASPADQVGGAGLLNTLIYMVLSPGTVAPEAQLFPGQAFVQVVLLLVAFVCVPWMLCVKPYVMYKEHQKKQGAGYRTVANDEDGDAPLLGQRDTAADDDDEDGEGAHGNGHASSSAHANGGGGGGHGDDEHGEGFGEIIIHQIIHVIEFCLGCISNTASYLRLWALSLAHAQLSEVLWSMTLEGALAMTGITGTIFKVVAIVMWFILSVAVLVVMEGLSAFLHALRLHWVEGASKHYQADGYAFQPLTFKRE